jgi:hypothetical protein
VAVPGDRPLLAIADSANLPECRIVPREREADRRGQTNPGSAVASISSCDATEVVLLTTDVSSYSAST